MGKTSNIQKSSPTIEMDVLKTFIAVAETKSMTSAARLVFRTPAAVSMQVKKLEEMLGKSLFKRNTRSISLTNDGETALSYGRRLINLNQELVNEFITEKISGSVYFGLPEQFGVSELPLILSQFSKNFPLISVDVKMTKSAQILDSINRGDLDVGLVSLENREEAPADSKLIREEKLKWVTRRDSNLAGKHPLSLSLAEPGCSWRSLAISALDNANIRYRIAYSSDNYIAQAAAVSADLAIAALPVPLIENHLIEVPEEYDLPKMGEVQTLLLIKKSPNKAVKALSQFIEHVLVK